MGDIADMMLEGSLCEGCGVALDGDAPGYPRRCRSCRKDAPNESTSAPRKHPGRNERARAKAAKGGELPQWALDAVKAGDPIVLRYHCAFCANRHFQLHAAVIDHLRDAHGVATGSAS